ncbi:hypothetical protein B9Z55_006287 [Caenorhabditis nigoni]|uniref:C-type lectin domain-containing protein n=2 Tax=Caenorhabditis nigoni TaxID=1611254 RepID=A0A2G5V561_9PELO|nr:hypothetical protein B9Z55_006287 [Caenorhabditis nigoni]
MVLIYGNVSTANWTSASNESQDSCISKCYYQTACFMAFMNSNEQCLLFDYSSTESLVVVDSNKSEGLIVAIKTRAPLTNTCPSYEQLEVTLNIKFQSWQRTKTGWAFRRCLEDWEFFNRNDTTLICVQGFYEHSKINKNDSIKACEEKGYKLTGVASRNEAVWMFNRMNELAPVLEGYGGFWIDGVRNGSEKSLFTWSDGYTTGNDVLNDSKTSTLSGTYGGTKEDCLAISKTGQAQIINDVECDSTQFGFVCGYQLN